jgi:hypothetical protein
MGDGMDPVAGDERVLGADLATPIDRDIDTPASSHGLQCRENSLIREIASGAKKHNASACFGSSSRRRARGYSGFKVLLSCGEANTVRLQR